MWWPGSLTCSRTAHSGFISSGPRRMECSVDARSLRLPGHQPEKQRKGQAVPGYPLRYECNGS